MTEHSASPCLLSSSAVVRVLFVGVAVAQASENLLAGARLPGRQARAEHQQAVFSIQVGRLFVAALGVTQIFPSHFPLSIHEDDHRIDQKWMYITSDRLANLPLQILFPLVYILIPSFLIPSRARQVLPRNLRSSSFWLSSQASLWATACWSLHSTYAHWSLRSTTNRHYTCDAHLRSIHALCRAPQQPRVQTGLLNLAGEDISVQLQVGV